MRNAATTGKRVGYGWLYNWYAVDDARGLAPTDWHVPTDAQWTELENYIGASPGGKLKSTRNEWDSPNTGATDEYNFAALPSGARNSDGSFVTFGSFGYWWSATEDSSTRAWSRNLNSSSDGLGRNNFLNVIGFGIRCIQAKAIGEVDGNTGTLTDIDGNIYKWVVIGDYRWMAEDLRTTKYKDGTTIPEVTNAATWSNLTTGARCAYDNDEYFVYPPKR